MGEIQKNYDTYQNSSHALVRYRISLPNSVDLKSKGEISLHLKILDENVGLRIVDAATHFSAAIFLDYHD